jgi:hypothetical protein
MLIKPINRAAACQISFGIDLKEGVVVKWKIFEQTKVLIWICILIALVDQCDDEVLVSVLTHLGCISDVNSNMIVYVFHPTNVSGLQKLF